jgi:hypothetical protein
MRLALALSLCAWPALAQEAAVIGEPQLYLGATVVRLDATEAPGAVAEVLFHNAEVNQPHDAGGYAVTREGLTVDLRFEFNVDGGGADRIVILPPDGYIAIPDTLTLPEGQRGRALIYPGNLS